MTEEIDVHFFKAGWENEDYGRVFFANDDFVTFMTKYPPGALRCSDMWNMGWEIYVQPLPHYSKDYRGGGDCYITTYKRRTLK
jgi:hypothetical protein